MHRCFMQECMAGYDDDDVMCAQGPANWKQREEEERKVKEVCVSEPSHIHSNRATVCMALQCADSQHVMCPHP